jgi:crotonobetainyl-CoA:carnitine CoA-transferase CaiB-like acyl-CoA transferase
MSELASVLAGVRVLDFGRYIAGPYCAALLADLGADVIRVERPGGGEDRWVAPVADDGVGAMYVVMNRNKRAMTLDPSCPEGREIVRKLVATADCPWWRTCRPRCCARSRSTSRACAR